MAIAFRDYYDALGVRRDASEDDIRRAYRRLARQYQPDVNKAPDAEDRFKAVSEAYAVLRDPGKRSLYDRFGENWKAGQDVSGAPGFGGDDGFSTRAADVEAVLDLSLEEAASGGHRWLSLGGGRSIEISIPPGVRDGQRIRVGGAGEGQAGDLYLRIRVRPDPRFRVEGPDVYTDLSVAPWEAALGASVEVQTLTRRVKLRVPPGSSSGRRLRLRGEGLGGDLYVVVKIVVPSKLSRKDRKLFEQLARTSKFDPRAEWR